MSLQVWLPLNGDLHNQGLGSISTTGTPTYKTNGKIGGNALDLKSRISITCPQIANLQTFSICFWAMAQSSSTLTNTWVDLIGFTDVSSSGTNGTFRWETCYNGSNKGIHWHDNATNALVNGSHNHIISHDVWTHCCVVFNNITKKIYSYDNGVLTQTHNHLGGSFNSTGIFYLGQQNVIEGMIQDVRIYDHALSSKEVEEISKGLILHYKLNNIVNPNLLKIKPKAYNETAYCSYQLNLIENLQANQTYTMQLWDVTIKHTGKTASNIGLSVYWGGESNGLKTRNGPSYYDTYDSETHTAHFDYASFQFTPTQANADHANGANAWLNIYNSIHNADGDRYMYIGNWKLEKGSVATPWCPFDSDTTIIHDSSGYENDGTIIGSLSTVADSARYNCATFISNGATNYIQSPTLQLPGDQITINYWFKSSNTSPGSNYHIPMNSYDTQAYETSIYKTGYFRSGLKVNGTRNIANCTSTQLLDGNWHMCSMTYDGTIIKRYVDGVMKKSTSVTGTLDTSESFIFGHYGSNTSYYCIDANISDARIYTTALTEAQIQELYNTSATIDNLGNAYARELVE